MPLERYPPAGSPHTIEGARAAAVAFAYLKHEPRIAIQVTAPGYEPVSIGFFDLPEHHVVDRTIEMKPIAGYEPAPTLTFRGVVRQADELVPNATVRFGREYATTAVDGSFEFKRIESHCEYS